MNKPRFLDRRIGFSVGALGMLFAMVAPAIVPAFASAAEVTTRSIQMSSSAINATGVSYDLTFTPQTTEATGDIVLWFCTSTPLVGQSCGTAPAGLSLSGVSLSSPSAGTPSVYAASGYVGASANYLVITGADLAATTPYSVTISGITNPSSDGTFYGRIETFAGDADAKVAGGDTVHGGTASGTGVTNLVDSGAVALAATNTIGVSAAVLESMQFCVFGDPNNNTSVPVQGTADSSTYVAGLTTGANGPATNCNDNATGHMNGSPTPSTQLGQVSSGVSALSTSTPSYAAEWAQLSTNANSGAVVYMKTANSCVGLFRAGEATATDCQIPSAGASAAGTLSAGAAGFGVSFGPAVSDGTTPTGAVDLNPAYANASSDYTMLDTGTSTGGDANGSGLTENVDSTYGGYVFGTGEQAASDWDIPFGLGASISNNTPAGSYSANLNLIAVGTF